MPDNTYAPFYEARSLITEILEKDFVGPVTEDEWLVSPPASYYLAGKLYPQSHRTAQPADEMPGTADNILMETDASLPLSSQSRQSSMALTFCVAPGVEHLELSGSFARYAERSMKDLPPAYAHLLPEGEAAACRRCFERCAESFQIRVQMQSHGPATVAVSEGLVLRVFFRPAAEGTIVTAALVNIASTSSREPESRLIIFQPQLTVHAPGLPVPFRPLPHLHAGRTAEQQDLEYLYGKHVTYANGHGCAVEWDAQTAPQEIRTCFMPHFDVAQMKPDGYGGQAVSMQLLAYGADKEIFGELRTFRDAYARWVDALPQRAAAASPALPLTAADHIAACRTVLDRITSGLDFLEAEPDGPVFRAFQLANEAMLLQRRQTVLRHNGSFDPEDARWYPFQLAFLLYEISSFADPRYSADGAHPDRAVADLLWFPTGGGKTEAYLGISAFAIFLRRLRNPDADGVTVITRYTMRLLTLQQFERASLLIAACELLRQKYALGGSEISIGLWVGESLAPNKLADAKACLEGPEGAFSDKGDPVQLRVCPWCGQPLSRDDYQVDPEQTRMRICCPNPECAFHAAENGLPVHVIDEAIYTHRPTFIVATVDKFAQMPLREAPATLFAVQSGSLPPELIIQDELHLISGQLGTIAGLYEVAISEACTTEEGWGAKIIASTATIRGADSQILSLYGRPHAQFPPPGSDGDDLYFASPAAPDERPTRRYLGIMGSATTNANMLVRMLASMLFASRYLAVRGFPDEVVDNFWTLTSYFNTIRELGQSASQILDEVQDRFRYLAKTKFAALFPGVEVKAYKFVRELTSRMNSQEIANVLQEGLLRSYSSSSSNKDVYDFLVATNMLSVGVDVGRLGTMIVAGQPKSNAEYIQATSRVGRNNPGLVVIVYYPTRSRDRSHYEQFQTYHSALYRHVEPVSLTPFSDRARGRALHALFVTLCRYGDPALFSDDSASNFRSDLPVVQRAKKLLEEYVARTDPGELDGLREDLARIISYWEQRAEAEEIGSYVNYTHQNQALFNTVDHNDIFYAMNSMRSVDVDVGIYMDKGDNYA